MSIIYYFNMSIFYYFQWISLQSENVNLSKLVFCKKKQTLMAANMYKWFYSSVDSILYSWDVIMRSNLAGERKWWTVFFSEVFYAVEGRCNLRSVSIQSKPSHAGIKYQLTSSPGDRQRRICTCISNSETCPKGTPIYLRESIPTWQVSLHYKFLLTSHIYNAIMRNWPLIKGCPLIELFLKGKFHRTTQNNTNDTQSSSLWDEVTGRQCTLSSLL